MRNCLYKLTFPNGKIYIGITNNFKRRMRSHRAASLKYKQPICRAIIKYGWDNIIKEILTEGEYNYIRNLESKAIVALNSRIPNGYNVSQGGEIAPSLAPEVRAKISLSNTGKKKTQEQLDKQAEASRLRWRDPLYRAKVLAGTIGKKRSAETKQKQSNARIGMKFSSEHRENLRKSHIGKISHGWSEQSRRKASLSRKLMLANKAKCK